MIVELHCHTTRSDGADSPDALVARARTRHLAVFAITDHDTCTPPPADLAGARCLRAAEVTCDDRGRTLHVLAYDRGGAGGDWAALESEFAAVRARRRDRLARDGRATREGRGHPRSTSRRCSPTPTGARSAGRISRASSSRPGARRR